MTRTEERLADALGRVASSIPDESLRQLKLAEPQAAGPGTRGGLTRWLAPAAAAAAVLVVVGVVASVTRPSSGAPARPFRDAATAASPPPYFVSIVGPHANLIEVRVTATGRVTDAVQPPRGSYATGPYAFWQYFSPSAVAAGGDLVFVVAYNNPVLRRTVLYRFGLTKAGKVTGFRPVPGGALPGLTNPALAVSADGTQVAVGGTPDPKHLNDYYSAVAPALIDVVNLRTGARRGWQGGMIRPGWQLSIPSVAWTPDGRSLVYVAQWCRPVLTVPDSATCGGGSGPAVAPQGPAADVEEISVAGGTGLLSSAHLLLRGSASYPDILQAVVSPGGEVVALAARGRHPYLLQFAVPSGRLQHVLYNGSYVYGLTVSLGLASAALSSDGSGRYFTLSVNLGTPTGWVARGQYHYIGQGSIWSAAW
jgi:hypothetical protein